MKAGACDRCILDRSCCGSCWCCPWPKTGRAGLVTLMARRPEFRDPSPDWWSAPFIAPVLVDATLWGA